MRNSESRTCVQSATKMRIKNNNKNKKQCKREKDAKWMLKRALTKQNNEKKRNEIKKKHESKREKRC